MTGQLNIFVREENVFTSFTASFLPNQIPYEPAWDPWDDHDTSPDDSTSPLTTRWAYAARPWFPLVPLNAHFDGAIFECLNHSIFSLYTEVNSKGKHMLHRDIREKWYELEQKLLWCLEILGAGLLIPWGTVLPRAPSQYGYLRSHSDAKLAKKVALRSRNAFLRLVIAAACSWHIMSHLYHGSNHPWMALLIDHPTCPIPAEWVHELSRSFVGDLSANVPRTGVFIPSNCCPWELQLPMYECFSIPVWVLCKQDFAFDLNLHRYHPSKEAIAQAIEEQRLAFARAIEGQRLCETTWGQDNGWGQDNDTTQSRSALGWDVNAFATQPAPGTALEAPRVDPAFPAPQRLSGQKSGEDWKTFFARHREENLKKEEKESPAQRQSRESREQATKNHSIPGQYSTATVFEWRPQDKFGGFLLRIRLTKAEVPDTWGNYSNSTRLYDSFRNEWDLCDQLDPTSTPDSDWEEDWFDFSAPVPDPVPLPPPTPPSLSSFLQDIHTYFGRHEVAASSDYTEGIERFISHLRFHLGFHLTASSTRPIGGTARPNSGTTRDAQNGSASTHGGAIRSNGGSTRPSGSTARSNGGTARSNPFESWVEKQKFTHICNIVGDSGKDVNSISDVQQHVITCFVGYLVTLPTSQLSEIPADHWDLAPGTPLSTLNAFIRVCYANIPGHDRHYAIKPSQSRSLLPWKLMVPDAATAVMCLHRDWGSDILAIAQKLLQKGIAFKTLQPMTVSPKARRPLSELRTFSLGYFRPPFKAVYADYIAYEQYRHEFMNEDRA
ncbi:hypothetical protein CY34DRAFT_110832 [Suillus luteus UH-Slu-Lm8-n1]|uniref:Unplaced genomic scaffold CY34scaffold_971, whole genome shotgun sequence n=1 Tax=Suillus luteus UH-Slu-Lm8-n1 TaxID=930992 RepID=A0A0D0ALN1_9AGAM|nr:hypothetical protein CY34DRAFT_110832 [Suillus luteus UH-Slu-Lm8-n1]